MPLMVIIFLILTSPITAQSHSCQTDAERKKCERALDKLDGKMNAYIAAQYRYEKALEEGNAKIKFIEINAQKVHKRYIDASKEVAETCAGKPRKVKVQSIESFIESIKNLGEEKKAKTKSYN